MAELKRIDSMTYRVESTTVTTALGQALDQERVVSKKRHMAGFLRRFASGIVASLVVLTILIQSAQIMATQQKILNLSNEITSLRRENEAKRVTVLKAQNVAHTKEVAAIGSFVDRNSKSSLTVDLNYDNFTGGEVQKAEESFLGKVLAFFK